MRNSNSAITNRRIQGLVNKASDEAGYYIPITYTQNDRRIVYEKMRNDRKLRLFVNLIVYRESFSALFKDDKTKLTVYYEFMTSSSESTGEPYIGKHKVRARFFFNIRFSIRRDPIPGTAHFNVLTISETLLGLELLGRIKRRTGGTGTTASYFCLSSARLFPKYSS